MSQHTVKLWVQRRDESGGLVHREVEVTGRVECTVTIERSGEALSSYERRLARDLIRSREIGGGLRESA